MAGTAERHEVLFIMRPTPGNRNDVMTFLCRNHPSFPKATFAIRMRQHVSVPDHSPDIAVLLMDIRSPLVSVIPPSFLDPMLLAVLTSRQIRASRMRAGMKRFSGHVCLLKKKEKSRQLGTFAYQLFLQFNCNRICLGTIVAFNGEKYLYLFHYAAIS